MTNITRRNILRGFVFVGSVILAGKYFYKVVKWKDKERMIADILHLRLHYLKIDSVSIAAFAKDFVEKFGSKQAKSFTTSRYGFLPFGNDYESSQEFYDFIAQTFLQSSNIWQKPFDDSKEVRFIKIYDPFASPCGNVFS
ncbi:MAG: hypothetical protein SGJ02_02280 [bacterium]|nr:hypothetical protein [bacterium]